MLSATCHCGSVRVSIPRKPRSITNCNCSICRRYGTLWAYYKQADVRVEAAEGATASYVWGDRHLAFVRCTQCGCVSHWQALKPGPGARMGVNARLFDPAALGDVHIRLLDGADTWKVLG
jgi:hypothetical protein